MHSFLRIGFTVVLLGAWSTGRAQSAVNSWPLAEQTAAANTPLTQERLARVERVVRALAALARREPSYCNWVGNSVQSTSLVAEASVMAAHQGVRTALAAGHLTAREFVEVSFSLLMAGMTYEAHRSGIPAPAPKPSPANVAFYASNHARIDRVFALDPC